MNFTERYFSTRIHVWGGLGSQLYALNCYLILREKFPRKRFVFVFHSSGITKRSHELKFQQMDIKNIVIDDFRLTSFINFNPSQFKRIIHYFRKGFKKALEFCGILFSFENIESLSRAKYWFFSVRGHYSNLPINQDRMKVILSLIQENSDSSEKNQDQNIGIGVHLRLGDLLQLEDKSPTDKHKLFAVIAREIDDINFGQKITIFSDSNNSEVYKYLKNSNFDNLQFSVRNESTFSTIFILNHAKVFVGTNSKISIWILLSRLYLGKSKNYVPSELEKAIEKNIAFPNLNSFSIY